MGSVTSIIKVIDGNGKSIVGALVSITNVSGNVGGTTQSNGTVTLETADIKEINVKAKRYGNSAFESFKPGGKITIMID